MANLANLAALSGLSQGIQGAQDHIQKQRTAEQLMALRQMEMDEYRQQQQRALQASTGAGQYLLGGDQPQGQAGGQGVGQPPMIPQVPSTAGAMEGVSDPQFKGLDPRLAASLSQLFAAGKGQGFQFGLTPHGGLRSQQDQERIYASSPPGMAAPPGSSMHQFGRAGDIGNAGALVRGGAPAQWLAANAPKYGLGFPVRNEPWHAELTGNRGGPQGPQPPQGAQGGGMQAGVPPQFDPRAVARAIRAQNPNMDMRTLMEAVRLVGEQLGPSSKEAFTRWHQVAQLAEKQQEFGERREDRRFEFGQREADRQAQFGIARQQHADASEDRKARLAESEREHRSLDEDRKLRREEHEREFGVRSEQKNQKVQQEADQVRFLADEAKALRDQVVANPKLSGTRGAISRGLGTVSELAGEASGGLIGGAPEGQAEQERFKARVLSLQTRAAKIMQGSRYFSAPVAARMNQLLPALNRFTAPTEAIQSLDELARQLEEISGTMTRAPQGGVPAGGESGYGAMSDDDLRKGLGLGQ